MNIHIYRVQDKETGKYLAKRRMTSVRLSFTKRGRVWHQLAHVRLSLDSMRFDAYKQFTRADLFPAHNNIIPHAICIDGNWKWNPAYSEQLRNERNLYRDMEITDYFPDTWYVVEGNDSIAVMSANELLKG